MANSRHLHILYDDTLLPSFRTTKEQVCERLQHMRWAIEQTSFSTREEFEAQIENVQHFHDARLLLIFARPENRALLQAFPSPNLWTISAWCFWVSKTRVSGVDDEDSTSAYGESTLDEATSPEDLFDLVSCFDHHKRLAKDSSPFAVYWTRSDDPCVIVSDGGRIIDINESAERLLQTHEKSAVLRRLTDYCEGEFLLGSRVAKLRSWEGTATLKSDGAADIRWSATPFGESSVAVRLERISESDAVRAQIMKAQDQADQASRAKNEFLANISHELRTPLNSILGMANLALELAKNPEQEEYLRILRISGEALYQLITSMLDYVKLESGTFNIREKSFFLSDTIDAVIAQFALNFARKNIAFHIITSPKDVGAYFGDETRVRQILTNLLSNAYKFTQEGTVTLEIREMKREESDPFAEGNVQLGISVHDTGCGIPQDKLEEVFQPFTQLEIIDGSSRAGTGIGLTITKLLVEAMHGTIRVESQIGIGSTFTVVLGLREGVKRRAGTRERFSNIPAVFLVGENESWFRSLTPYLGDQGFSCSMCRNAAEFFDVISDRVPPDALLILQGNLSYSEDVIRYLKSDRFHALCSRPQLLTLALDRRGEDRWSSAPFPFSLFFEPFKPSSIAAMLEQADIERLSISNRPGSVPPAAPKESIKIVFADDEALYRLSMGRLLESAGHRVMTASNGAEFLTIVESQKPDIAVIDISMPEMNGYEATSLLRAGHCGEHGMQMPVIALTAYDTLQDRKSAEQAGMNAFLSKPYTSQALLTVVERVWRQHVEGRKSTVREIPDDPLGALRSRLRAALNSSNFEEAQKFALELREILRESRHAAFELSFRLLLAVRRCDKANALLLVEELNIADRISAEKSEAGQDPGGSGVEGKQEQEMIGQGREGI